MDRFEAVFQSLDVIEERIREKLTVEKLADSVHFSRYHYQRLFREAVGESVMRYVAGRRMALAARELAETDATVLEIALRYGYDSHEGFTRNFRTHMGVTPAEYRKYHFSIGLPQTRKERSAMMYSKNTDEIIRELNGLIVQVRETAAFTEKNRNVSGEETYGEFWRDTAGRAEAVADDLAKTLGQVTAIAQRPDEISARFMILKAVEDAAFWLRLTAFQTRLTVARARPEHRSAFEPICGRYESLARNAGTRAGRIAAFLGELAELIFRDMRENAAQCLQKAVESGRAAAEKLSGDPELPYGYIAEAVRGLAEELGSLPLREVNVNRLEDYCIRLDIIGAAGTLDGWRAPEHRELLDGIGDFRLQLDRTLQFFRDLPMDTVGVPGEISAGAGAWERTAAKAYEDMVFQGGILLFYLKGELEKMGALLDRERRAALEELCGRMERVIKGEFSDGETDRTAAAARNLREIQAALAGQARELEPNGAAIEYIAQEIANMADRS